MLADYHGTVILVSHDRDFIDRVVSFVINFEGNGKWQSYAGGYSDMMVQRAKSSGAGKAGKSTRKSSAKKHDSLSKQGEKPASKRLSYKDKFALENLPKEMEKLENQIAAYQAKLAVPDYYINDPDGFQKTSKQLASAENSLANMEEQWLELEMLREEIEQG